MNTYFIIIIIIKLKYYETNKIKIKVFWNSEIITKTHYDTIWIKKFIDDAIYFQYCDIYKHYVFQRFYKLNFKLYFVSAYR